MGNGINSIYVIEYMRSGYMEHRWGGIHATDICAALPFVDAGEPFTYELFLLQNPKANATRTTLSSMTYLGSLYGDFGWLGAVGGFFCLGGITAVSGQHLFQKQKTVPNVAFVGMAVMCLGQLNLNGIVYCGVSLVVLLVVTKLYEFCVLIGSSSQQNIRPSIQGSRQSGFRSNKLVIKPTNKWH